MILYEPASDQEWVVALHAGRVEAYEALWRYLSKITYNLCTRRGADLPWERQLALAEEIAQEGLLQVWRKLDAYRQDGPFLAWATRIVVNKFRDRMRQERPWQANIAMDESIEIYALGQLDMDLADVLKRGMHGLSPQERAVLSGRLLEERSSEEIASALHISRGNERITYLRARQKLRAFLEAHGYFPP